MLINLLLALCVYCVHCLLCVKERTTGSLYIVHVNRDVANGALGPPPQGTAGRRLSALPEDYIKLRRIALRPYQ